MGKVGLVIFVGFMLGVTCACILVGGGEFCFFSPSDEQGLCEVVYFGVSVEILSADKWVCVFILLVVWRRSTLGANSPVMLVLYT